MDQYNPLPYWKQYDDERHTSNSNSSLLAEKGEIPPRDGGGAQTPEQKYANICASCHGAKGAGDGAAGASLNPKPRNFHDKAWHAKVTDDHIANVIKNGGTAAGLSATMPAWGSQLSDADLKGIVEMIRVWGK